MLRCRTFPASAVPSCRRTLFLNTHHPPKAHTVQIVSNKSVLVVDDDTSIRGMVRSVLHREGFAVEEVGGGNDAIALMTDKTYDAVVLDVMMGEGNGEDVLRALAAMRPGHKCVVVISAAAPTIIDQLGGPNIHTKLRKPFDITALVDAIRECLTSPNDRDAAT